MANRPARDPFAQLTQEIADLRRQLNDLATKPLVVPVINADPGTGYPGNLFVYPDGRIMVRMKDNTLRQIATVAATAAAGSNPAPPAQPVTRVGWWVATWGQAYRASGGFTGSDNSTLQHGSSGDSYNGRQRSLIGFDYASMQSALSGSQVVGCRLWLYQRHTWYIAGGTVWIGMHNNATKPGTYGGTIGRDFVSSASVHRSSGEWHNLSTEFGSRIRDNAAKGVLLNAPNDDRTYYGYAAGGPGTPANLLPTIEVTYLK